MFMYYRFGELENLQRLCSTSLKTLEQKTECKGFLDSRTTAYLGCLISYYLHCFLTSLVIIGCFVGSFWLFIIEIRYCILRISSRTSHDKMYINKLRTLRSRKPLSDCSLDHKVRRRRLFERAREDYLTQSAAPDHTTDQSFADIEEAPSSPVYCLN